MTPADDRPLTDHDEAAINAFHEAGVPLGVASRLVSEICDDVVTYGERVARAGWYRNVAGYANSRPWEKAVDLAIRASRGTERP